MLTQWKPENNSWQFLNKLGMTKGTIQRMTISSFCNQDAPLCHPRESGNLSSAHGRELRKKKGKHQHGDVL